MNTWNTLIVASFILFIPAGAHADQPAKRATPKIMILKTNDPVDRYGGTQVKTTKRNLPALDGILCQHSSDTTPYCMTSRASILTGRYESKIGDNVSTEQGEAPFTYSPAKGIGPEPGVMRRDPSDIIRVKGLYYVWYSKGKIRSGYDASIWYATSKDGRNWTEKGEALKRGAKKAWDEQSVFTPNILVAEGKYWLFYTGVPKPFIASGKNTTKTAIGIAVADSPDGPWVRLEANPILIPSDDPTAFDSLRVDDACLIFWNGRYYLFYKGRQQNNSPANTKMGVAIATKPGGPYIKHAHNPVVKGGHEVVVWPYGKGIVAMVNIGPKGIAKTLQYSPDGVTFSKWHDLKSVPHAAGMYRPEAFTDSGRGKMPEWGVQIGTRKQFLPFIERFDCHWPAENSIPLPKVGAKPELRKEP